MPLGCAAVDETESIHPPPVDGHPLRGHVVLHPRDHVGGPPERDGASVRKHPGRGAVTRVMRDDAVIDLAAEFAQDVVEAVVLLKQDHDVLDRGGIPSRRGSRRGRTSRSLLPGRKVSHADRERDQDLSPHGPLPGSACP